MAELPEFLNRIRDWVLFYKKEVVFALIIFLVASLSFGLGYLANREFNHAPIIIEKVESSE
ncbi:MAG: hypothetical protein UY96_C0006G0015 [Parcubacteria group bacterium GW2011_GWB1_56_8]|nr:MAG: hypothetical protein UY96_C0006G0015 [Parcubacteria group bacterium GW2011_GWB1_56_8]